VPAAHRPSLLIRCLLLCGTGALLSAPVRAAAAPIPPPEVTLRAIFHCFWDRDYLYLAAQVDDPQLIGVNASPMSQPWADDSVELFIHFGDPHDSRPSPLTHRIAFSVAGGFSFLEGTEAGEWRENLTWRMVPRSLKFVATPDGELNDPKARARGYIIEAAVPWLALGVLPTPDAEVAANVVVWQRGDTDGFQSWSPAVKTEDDLSRPDRWATFVLTAHPIGARSVADRLEVPFTPIPAFVNGELSATEYLRASTLVLTRTAPAIAIKPPLDHAPLLAVWYLPCVGPACPHEVETAELQPLIPPGPWVDGRRPAWQREQLLELAGAGADIALVGTRLPGEPMEPFYALLSALNELDDEPRSIPRLALALRWEPETRLDADTAIAAAVGRMALIPDRDRARVMTPAGPMCLVVLDDAPPGAAADFPDRLHAALTEALGEPVLVVGHRSWKPGAEEGPMYLGLSAPLSVAALSPVSGGPGPGGWQEGRVYRSQWLTALAARPQLFLVNSWNDFAAGDAIAPTRQFGVQYRDATRRFAAQAGGLASSVIEIQPPLPLLPLQPGVRHQLPLVLDNRGAAAVDGKDRISIQYELLDASSDEVMSEGPAVNGYLTLAAGSRATVFAFIGTVAANGASVKPGAYTLRLRLVQLALPYLQSKRFQRTLAVYQFPVQVAEVGAPALEVMDSGVVHDPKRGEQAILVLRNAGRRKINLRDARLAYRWRSGETVSPPQAVRLSGTVDAGSIVTTTAGVTFPEVDASHNPTPVMLEWGILDAQGAWSATLPGPGRAVPLLLQNGGANLLNGDLADGGDAVAARVTVRNDGGEAWSPDTVAVVWEWFRWDGAPTGLRATRVPLPAEVPPSGTITVRAELPKPPTGSYLCAARLVRGDQPLHGPAEWWWAPYRADNGRFTAVPLGETAKRIVATSELRREQGLFTNDAQSLPSEQLPPDLTAPGPQWFPCGYYVPGSDCAVSFQFPAQVDGTARGLVPDGQHLEFSSTSTRTVHLLAAAAGPGATLTVTLHFGDGSTADQTLAIGDWNAPAPAGAHTAWQAPFRYSLAGFDRRPVYLHDYAIPVAGTAPLVGITFQPAPSVRVLAITLEHPAP